MAQKCVALAERIVDQNSLSPLWVEPATGAGSFLLALRQPRLGEDIAPRHSDVIRADFLTWRPAERLLPVFVIGNPPFGKNASLAIRFFNHAATFADWIGFIVPLTFRKASTHAKLDRRFHIVHDEELERRAFVFEDEPYDVPTAFQIWERRREERDVLREPTRHPDFHFTRQEEALFAFQRVGARAGLVSRAGLCKSPQSHYFILPTTRSIDVERVLGSINWEPIKRRTAGNPSIGKAELVRAYSTACR